MSLNMSKCLLVKYPLILLSYFNKIWIFRRIFEESSNVRNLLASTHISSFIKIRPMGAEIFHAHWQTDGYDEANSRFSQILPTRLKTCIVLWVNDARKGKEIHTKTWPIIISTEIAMRHQNKEIPKRVWKNLLILMLNTRRNLAPEMESTGTQASKTH
jgi:hypothetical protein